MARLVEAGGAEFDVSDWGDGEPLLLVQTALTADELRPIADDAALADGFRKILYYRRGYRHSSPADGPGSIDRDAADAANLLTALGIARAHVLGVSYSAAVALALAAHAPDRVKSLVTIEPPPVHTPSNAEFRAANARLSQSRHTHGPAAALDEFLTTLLGASWRAESDLRLPGSAQQMDEDAETFFDADLPALMDWRFSRDDAAQITCPVLYVGGTGSGPWFAEVRDLMLDWLPHAEDVLVPAADHWLAVTHAHSVAMAVAGFRPHRVVPVPQIHAVSLSRIRCASTCRSDVCDGRRVVVLERSDGRCEVRDLNMAGRGLMGMLVARTTQTPPGCVTSISLPRWRDRRVIAAR